MGRFFSRKLDERTTTDPSASNIRISNGSVTYKQLMVKLSQLFKETVTQVSMSSQLLINSLYTGNAYFTGTLTFHQDLHYSKTCVKRPLSKRTKNGFQDQLLLNAGQKYCRMLQRENSTILI